MLPPSLDFACPRWLVLSTPHHAARIWTTARMAGLASWDSGSSSCLCLSFCVCVTSAAVRVSAPSKTADDVPQLVAALLQTRIYVALFT